MPYSNHRGQSMLNEFSRTQLLLGKDAMDVLAASSVAVFGIGGVGSYTAEALARCGVGTLALFDDDRVCMTNINRQLIATHKTIGQKKVEVMKNRIHEINPNCTVEPFECFYSPSTADQYDLSKYHYVVDAIDTVSCKLALIENARNAGVPIISAMGAGNKLDPTRFEIADIFQTSVCPLAKVMRKELRARGIDSLKVVYSKEEPIRPLEEDEISCKNHCVCPPDTKRKCTIRRQVPGSVSFVPSVMGLIIASAVVKDLIKS